MKAWEVHEGFGLDNLVLGERPEPVPGPGQVLLAMRAASLNYRDSVVVGGGYGKSVTPPLIPVSDGVGEVVATGPDADRLEVGERVCPMFFPEWYDGDPAPETFEANLGASRDGVLAEYVCMDQRSVARVPDHLSDEEAACLPCAALTAWSALITQSDTGPGDTVLVQGTGGVALFAVQFAKALGARVIITSSSDDKLASARDLGADETINYKTDPDWDKAARDLTEGRGCDHVIELGGAETLKRSVRAVRAGGQISLIGVLSGPVAELTLPLIVMRNVRIQGITVGSRAGFEAMCETMERRGLRPVIDQVFPFAEARAAFEHLLSGAHFGKVCIRYRGTDT